MLSLQSRGQTEKREAEALLQESVRTRDELKSRAQEAVRQWRAKCRRLQKELEEARADAQFHTDKASQVSGGGTFSSSATTLNKQPLKLAARSRPEDKQALLILTNTWQHLHLCKSNTYYRAQRND